MSAAAPRVGFLGLGIMGAQMASRLVGTGQNVMVYNRSVAKAEPLRQLGAAVASTPAEVTSTCDLVFAGSRSKGCQGGRHGRPGQRGRRHRGQTRLRQAGDLRGLLHRGRRHGRAGGRRHHRSGSHGRSPPRCLAGGETREMEPSSSSAAAIRPHTKPPSRGSTRWGAGAGSSVQPPGTRRGPS